MPNLIFNIENRAENWLCAQHFVPLVNSEKLNKLALQIIKNHQEDDMSNETNFNLELFWRGFRDFLHQHKNINIDDKIKTYYNHKFSNLRSLIADSKVSLEVKDDNYTLTNQNLNNLVNNLKNTEIDIVISNGSYLLIGEAKHTQTFGSDGENVLTHQLIRQYVMGNILADVIKITDKLKSSIRVIPFIVCHDRNQTMRNNQVKFMLEQKWLYPNNIIQWVDIVHLNK